MADNTKNSSEVSNSDQADMKKEMLKKQQSETTRVDPAAGDGASQQYGQGNPDPKTVSNATRVNETTKPDPDGHPVHEARAGGENTMLSPSSPQPEELEAYAQEEQQQKEEGRKKKATEGGEKDVSHATIGKDEEKSAKQQNKDAKKSKDSKKQDQQQAKSHDLKRSSETEKK